VTNAEETVTTRARIMIAEDETIIRMDLRQLLEGAGFDVCAEARDGVEAVELARSEHPDLAIMDVKMPRMDGIEAARQITSERPIPIVMLTAYGEAQLVSRAVEAGAFGYLLKPFREHDIAPAIQTALARHRELVASGRHERNEPLHARLEAIGEEVFAAMREAGPAPTEALPSGPAADWRVALDLDPDDIGPVYNRGLELEREGRIDEAMAAWRFIIEWLEARDAAVQTDWPKQELARLRELRAG
jgi:CheY-like chemotaxis protein